MENKTKRTLLTVLAIVLVAAVSVAGTLAYLQASSKETLTNTFVMAGGGDLIEDDDPDPAPSPQPSGADPNFFLSESPATYADGAYTLDTTSAVVANQYDKVAPDMEISKDPSLHVNIATGAEAYVFVTVTDTLVKSGDDAQITWTAGDDWENITTGANSALTSASKSALGTGVTLLVYKGANAAADTHIVTGKTTGEEGEEVAVYEIDGSAILKDAKVAVGHNDEGELTGTDGALGTLVFNAYVCQAQGFANAAAAYAACFGTSNG